MRNAISVLVALLVLFAFCIADIRSRSTCTDIACTGPNMNQADHQLEQVVSASFLPGIQRTEAGQVGSYQSMEWSPESNEETYYRASEVEIIVVDGAGCESVCAYRYVSEAGDHELIVYRDAPGMEMESAVTLSGVTGGIKECKGGAVDQPMFFPWNVLVRSYVCMPRTYECQLLPCPHTSTPHYGTRGIEDCRNEWGEWLCTTH